MTRILSHQERQFLAEKIRFAETSTRGEIYCVVARQSDNYFYPASFMLTVGILIVSLPLGLWLDNSWLQFTHSGFTLAQIVAFVSALLILKLAPHLRIIMVPRKLRYRRAHDNAVKQFLAHNVHLTEQRTGILIFVSLAEKYAEIVADAAINDRVPQEEWNKLVERVIAAAGEDRLYEGLSDVIERSSALLVQHFPSGVRNPNELQDHVTII